MDEAAVSGVLPASRKRGSLWRNADFLKLWAGESVSVVGSQITALALPLTAVMTLDASAAQMGLLGAAAYAPFLLVTLPAGVVVDRMRRRPLLVWTSLARGALLALVPIAAVLGFLEMQILYAVAFAGGVLAVFAELAFYSFVPSLVARQELVEANSKLQVSVSAAQVGGPGLGGLLVELLTAPVALVADAASFVAAAAGVAAVRSREERPAQRAERRLRREVAEGLRVTFGNPYLRGFAGEAAMFNLCWQAIDVVLVLWAVKELGLRPGLLGLALSAGAVGSLAGALVAAPLARRLGLGPAIVSAMAIACAVPLLLPLAAGPPPAAAALLAVVFFVSGIGVTVSNVHVVSVRQAVTPDRLLGRMHASYRFVVYGAIPVGALAGGLLGEAIGLRPTLVVASLGLLLAVVPVLLSPVPRLRDLPSATD